MTIVQVEAWFIVEYFKLIISLQTTVTPYTNSPIVLILLVPRIPVVGRVIDGAAIFSAPRIRNFCATAIIVIAYFDPLIVSWSDYIIEHRLYF